MDKLKTAKLRIGLSGNTLRKMADDGLIKTIRSPGGQRLFDTDAYLKAAGGVNTICYCRVSSYKQRDDLERQIESMRTRFPQAEIVKDIGSGLNFKRKGLNSILERLLCGDKLKVVVAHRDRLARFGVELIRFLITQNGGEFVVLDPYQGSIEHELTQDLLSILHHFSCRMHGSRKYACGEANTDQAECATKDLIQELVCRLTLDLQQDGGAPKPVQGDAAEALDGCGEIDIA